MKQTVSLKEFNQESPAMREILFSWEADNSSLQLSYLVTASDGLVWPSQNSDERTYELWRSTCLEFFVKKINTDEYLEFNFCPSGRWDIYHFDSYRSPSSPRRIELKAPIIKQSATTLVVEIEIPWQHSEVLINPTAVIEDANGIHYFAYKHASAKPDFHAVETLTLKL